MLTHWADKIWFPDADAMREQAEGRKASRRRRGNLSSAGRWSRGATRFIFAELEHPLVPSLQAIVPHVSHSILHRRVLKGLHRRAPSVFQFRIHCTASQCL